MFPIPHSVIPVQTGTQYSLIFQSVVIECFCRLPIQESWFPSGACPREIGGGNDKKIGECENEGRCNAPQENAFLVIRNLFFQSICGTIARLISFLEMSNCKAKILEIKKDREVLTNVAKTVIKYKRKKARKNEVQNAEALLNQELNPLDS